MRTKLDKWVSNNNPPDTKQFSKGWWDFIELCRELQDIHKADCRVIATIEILTPPPTETLEMPIVQLTTNDSIVTIKNDFGQWPYEYVCSIKTLKPFKTIYGLFDPQEELHERLTKAMPKAHRYPTHKHNQQAFTCALPDRDALVILFWLLTHTPKQNCC